MTSGSSVNALDRARDGTFQLTPALANRPFFAWNVRPSVARVRFSVADVTGARVESMPTIDVPVIVATPLEGICPLSSPESRNGLRDGNATPVPQRNAPVGASIPSGL